MPMPITYAVSFCHLFSGLLLYSLIYIQSKYFSFNEIFSQQMACRNISPYLYYLIPRLLTAFWSCIFSTSFSIDTTAVFFFRFTFADTPSKRFNAFFNPIFAMFTGHAFDLYPLLTYDIFQFFLFVLICEEPPQHPPCPLKCFVPERIPVNTRIKSTAIIISFTIFPRSFLHIYFQFIKTFIRQDIFQHTGLFFCLLLINSRLYQDF